MPCLTGWASPIVLVVPPLSAATATIVDSDKRDLREPDAGGTKFCQNFEESDLVIWSTARTPPE